ncbi:MAG: ribonuclease HI family protein [Ktedonobacterales bacterium]
MRTEGAGVSSGGRLLLRTDGASRGNPGPAAAGVVIEDANGMLLARGKKYLGRLTNNQAEYQALILGLKAVAARSPASVAVYMDSELIVKQMNGQYRVKDAALRSLFDEARSLVSALSAVSFTHVRRGFNTLADALANEALDEEAQRARG